MTTDQSQILIRLQKNLRKSFLIKLAKGYFRCSACIAQVLHPDELLEFFL